ncbi:hypothetical protein D3C79_792900 [compost metagenome]
MVLVRDVEIEQARFEGLLVVRAEQGSVAVEVQAAVDAEDRDIAVLGAREVAAQITGGLRSTG